MVSNIKPQEKSNKETITKPTANIADGILVINLVVINSLITGIPATKPKTKEIIEKKEKKANGL